MPQLEATPTWLRSGIYHAPKTLRVDRDAMIIYGYNVAQLGQFNDSRGIFDDKALDMIVEQMNASPKGLKSRFTHPGLSGDGLGKFLGRARHARREDDSVRADMHLDPTSRKTPSGDLGGYVMDLAESDPEAFGSSLVIQPKRVKQLDENGRQKIGNDGEPLPDFWYPEKLHASDVVDEPAATRSGFLSSGAVGVDFDKLPDAELRQGWQLLDSAFPGQPRDVVEARLTAFLGRYLDHRYGPIPAPVVTPAGMSLAMRERILRTRSLDSE